MYFFFFYSGSNSQSSPSSLGVGARRSPLWPTAPMVPCPATCRCVSDTRSSTQVERAARGNSFFHLVFFSFSNPLIPLVVFCVRVGFCGERNSAHLLFVVVVSSMLCWQFQERLLSLSHCLSLWRLQRPVLGLVASQDALAAAAVLAQLRHLLPQRRVLPLQEGGAHCDLVLLQPPGVAGALGSYVVLLPTWPVLLILGEAGEHQIHTYISMYVCMSLSKLWVILCPSVNVAWLAKQHLLPWLCPTYLLLVRDKHFLCLLDHGLRLQLLVRELVLTRVEQLSARHAGQHQVCGIWLEVDVHLYGVRVNGRWRVAFFGVSGNRGQKRNISSFFFYATSCP